MQLPYKHRVSLLLTKPEMQWIMQSCVPYCAQSTVSQDWAANTLGLCSLLGLARRPTGLYFTISCENSLWKIPYNQGGCVIPALGG